MPAPGALSVGRPVNPTTGSAQVVLPRGGQLLGFFIQNAATTVQLYDAASTTGLPTAILNTGLIGPGWFPFPVDLVNGLVATTTGGTAIFAVL